LGFAPATEGSGRGAHHSASGLFWKKVRILFRRHSPSSLRSSGPSALIYKRKKVPSNSEGYVFIMSYFVYILECADKSLYVGCTNNLERRLEQHNNSKSGAHYTKIRRPVILIYKEEFSTLKEARGREAEIKGWRREKKFNLINKRVSQK
jgi:putative endonuclease